MKHTKFYQTIGHICFFGFALTSCSTSEQKSTTPASPLKDTIVAIPDTSIPAKLSTQDSAKKLKDSVEKLIEETPLDISVDSF